MQPRNNNSHGFGKLHIEVLIFSQDLVISMYRFITRNRPYIIPQPSFLFPQSVPSMVPQLVFPSLLLCVASRGEFVDVNSYFHGRYKVPRLIFDEQIIPKPEEFHLEIFIVSDLRQMPPDGLCRTTSAY